MTKGQAALEFLSTYGLAFLALLITLGAISYLDVFNVGSVRSNECSFPAGMDCLDFVFSAADPGSDFPGTLNPLSAAGENPYLRMIIYNSYGVNLTVRNATLTLEQFDAGTNTSCAILPAGDGVAWAAGSNTTFWCPVPSAIYHPRAFYSGTVAMEFTQEGGSYVHHTKGLLAVTAQ